ncbi:hypothetical protein GR925_25810 [Streptomyces sp. HUCO-GS316]|uniref:hypothetical protein n=1 Tax=Streptomyces sp. HUCO-GS316 TaxID=2692198 RepID=UPI001367D0D3|nr:hypothetical protein [Streptomyces sp. HUCO-GS316]MXM66753.1 hypothetical protein [Streptomyces sp. HUCO-GS316]
MSSSASRPQRGPARRPSNTHRPSVSRPGAGGSRFGMFAVCVARDSEPELNKGKAKPLYDVLVSYADGSSRDTGQGYPYREALAAHLDCSPQTIDRATKYLEQEIGLIRVVRRKVEGKANENDANLYVLHDSWLIHAQTAPADTPPQLVARYGHTVPGFDVDAWMEENAPDFDLTGWRAAHAGRIGAQQQEHQERRRKDRARKRKSARKGSDVTGDVTPMAEEFEGGDVTGDGTCPVTHDVTGGVMGEAVSTTVVPEPSSTDGAPSARSAADVRRTTAGSSACEEDSGCAATEQTSPVADDDERGEEEAARPAKVPGPRGGKRKPSPFPPELRQRIYAAESLLPAPLLAVLREKLPHGHLPNTTRQVTAQALETRTPEELGERAARRWITYGYERDHYDGLLRSPLGVVEELFRPTPYCPLADCEDGRDRHTGLQCSTCAERIEQRKRDRRAGRPVSTARPTRLYRDREECAHCSAPLPRDAAAGDLCHRCARQMDQELAELHERLGLTGTAAPTTPDPDPADARYAPAPPSAEYRAWRAQQADGAPF